MDLKLLKIDMKLIQVPFKMVQRVLNTLFIVMPILVKFNIIKKCIFTFLITVLLKLLK